MSAELSETNPKVSSQRAAATPSTRRRRRRSRRSTGALPSSSALNQGAVDASVKGHAAVTASGMQPVMQRRTPVYDLLTDNQLELIESKARWILEKIGVEIHNDNETLELFRSAGASVQKNRVHFPDGLAEELCSTAPAQFNMYGRDGRVVPIGGDNVVLLPAYGPPFVSDLDSGRRYATIEDFENFVKLTYSTPWLHHSGGTVCEPVDLPVNKRHLDMVYAHLRWSTKPFMGAVTAPDRAEDSIAMARIAFADFGQPGVDYLKDHCVIQGNINVNSPLVWDDVMAGALKAYARANQSCVVSPFIIGGAMGPVTQAALIAQAHAEALSGIALTQIVRPGAPVVYGNFLTTMNLRSGAPTFGTPESALSTYAVGQLARRRNLPLRCGAHYTASKAPDAQAMSESADAMWPGIMAGTNFIIHAAGWLEGGLVMSYEKFMLDLDRCGMLHRQLGGLDLSEEHFAAEAYLEAGPGKAFLGTAHTLAHCRSANYESPLADTTSYEQWSEQGSLTAAQRANLAWKAALANYVAPDLPPGIDSELKAFIRDRKDGLPDMWY